MLKVQIKDPQSGFRMNTPIPYHLFIDLFIRKSTARLVIGSHRFAGGQQQKWIRHMIENIDYAELRRTLHQIKAYRGLSFVDVEASDGTIVKIINT